MSNHPFEATRPSDHEPEHSAWGVGTLLRAAADGELPAAQQARLDQHLARVGGDGARIDFERQLRQACARVLRTDGERAPRATRELRATVERLANASRSSDAGAPAVPTIVHVGERREEGVLAGRRPSRGSRLVRAGWLALAACTLVVGVVVGMRLAAPAPSFRAEPERARIALVGFLESEHRRCAISERALKNKMTVYQLGEAPAKFASLLGAELSIAAVERAGYEFLGSGRCAVPGRGESVHMIFRDPSASPLTAEQVAAMDGCDPTKLSVFVQSDTGELPITAGKTYRLETGVGELLVVVWSREGLIYFLLTETQAVQDRLMEALEVPAATNVL